jgi:hypothetical protein
MKGLILVAMMVMGFQAGAQGLFYDDCAYASNMEMDPQVFFVAGTGPRMMGLTCEDLRGAVRAAQIVEMALYPATLALTLSPAKAELMATLAQLGLTMANPAVLGVTIIGATGVVVLYLVMKNTLEECERLDQVRLKNAILQEVEAKYGISGRGVPLKVRKR